MKITESKLRKIINSVILEVAPRTGSGKRNQSKQSGYDSLMSSLPRHSQSGGSLFSQSARDNRKVTNDYADNFYHEVAEKISEHLHDMGAEDLGENYEGVIDDLANELAGQFALLLQARREFVAGIVEMNKSIAHIEEIEQSLENGKLAQMFDDYDEQSSVAASSSKGYDLACIISDIKDDYIQYIVGLSNSQITSLEQFAKKTDYDR